MAGPAEGLASGRDIPTRFLGVVIVFGGEAGYAGGIRSGGNACVSACAPVGMTTAWLDSRIPPSIRPCEELLALSHMLLTLGSGIRPCSHMGDCESQELTA